MTPLRWPDLPAMRLRSTEDFHVEELQPYGESASPAREPTFPKRLRILGGIFGILATIGLLLAIGVFVATEGEARSPFIQPMLVGTIIAQVLTAIGGFGQVSRARLAVPLFTLGLALMTLIELAILLVTEEASAPRVIRLALTGAALAVQLSGWLKLRRTKHLT